MEEARRYTAAVITLSDKGFKGEREDLSGPAIREKLQEKGYEVIEAILLPDGIETLRRELMRICDEKKPDLILTTGGTGFAPRDVTPEATLQVADRLVPGISEAIREASMQITPRAMLSRGVSVIRGKTLIINLPGSPKAVRESMEVFMDVIPHAIDLLRNTAGDCARS
ncbi:MAG: MogA/MoaB family molybdenum cofactor biosynthesis protein [Clostridia bacterium]|nr:MogA/MoaB family molybdenum cofactor biosynthesis protein [Clostridia bacterium]